LHAAWESGNATFLSFSRNFETCDNAHDLPIDNNLLAIIWSMGESDNIDEYHFENKGSYDLYLLDRDMTPANLNETRVFQITETITLPERDTLYSCSFHMTPEVTKHHIIGV